MNSTTRARTEALIREAQEARAAILKLIDALREVTDSCAARKRKKKLSSSSRAKR